MNNPFISVIIPNYNYGHFIKNCLKSILAQALTDYEVIVIDDGSTDNSREVVESMMPEFDGKLRYYFQNNQGVAVARNTGLDLANGKYIAFLDADDIWHDHALQALVERMISDPNLGLVYGNAEFRSAATGKPMGRRFYKGSKHIPYHGNCLDKLVIYGDFIVTSACISKKQILIEEGRFDERFKVGEDYDMWMRISGKYPIGYIDQVLCERSRHEKSTSRNYFAGAKARYLILKKILGLYPELNSTIPEKEISRIKYVLYYELGRQYILNSRPKRGRALFAYALSISVNPFRSKIYLYYLAAYPLFQELVLSCRQVIEVIKIKIFGAVFHT